MLIALFLVLWRINRKRQTSWTFKFTPNTVISVLSTTAKSSSLFVSSAAIGQEKWVWFGLGNRVGYPDGTRLADLQVFDDASRGPLGSISLLWMTKCSRRLASLGALVTIISLAMDPFTQQVLEIQFRQSVSHNNLTVESDVQRTERYNSFSSTTLEPSNGDANLTKYVTLSMRASIINGLMTSPIIPINLKCPTGNCQWPVIPSLGVCSECVELSSILLQPKDQLNGNPNLPNGIFALNRTGIVIVPQGTAGSIHFKESNVPYLSIFDMIITRNESQPIEALECALWPCIQALNVTSIQGLPSQNVIRTHSNYTKYTNYTYHESPTSINRNGFPIVPTAIEVNSRAAATPPLRDYTLTRPDDPIFNTLPGVRYSISVISVNVVSGLLNSTFSGNSYDNSSSDGIRALMSTSGRFDNVATLMSNLADSMTNEIRLSPALQRDDGEEINPWHVEQYVGEAWTTVGFFHVRWLYMILPTVVVVMSVVFLLFSARENTVSGARLWKGSILPVLFLPLGGGIREKFTLESTTREMEDYADKVRGGFASLRIS
ncbi:hypothetical protein BKA61DRAFT_711009 [Leptodontidium sp. MPI-SDFR-AT-0119]|nr:hypothetical protein BKA61DRAFT_711009 [Leptodontidium sp. MPI-SDFR-AT-0119]